MMKTPLEDMGNYDIRNVDVEPLLVSYQAEARVIRGMLDIEPPIKGGVPLEPNEQVLKDLPNPIMQGDFVLSYEHAVLTPGDEYWEGGMVTFYSCKIMSPYNPELLDLRDRYFLPHSLFRLFP